MAHLGDADDAGRERRVVLGAEHVRVHEREAEHAREAERQHEARARRPQRRREPPLQLLHRVRHRQRRHQHEQRVVVQDAVLGQVLHATRVSFHELTRPNQHESMQEN